MVGLLLCQARPGGLVVLQNLHVARSCRTWSASLGGWGNGIARTLTCKLGPCPGAGWAPLLRRSAEEPPKALLCFGSRGLYLKSSAQSCRLLPKGLVESRSGWKRQDYILLHTVWSSLWGSLMWSGLCWEPPGSEAGPLQGSSPISSPPHHPSSSSLYWTSAVQSTSPCFFSENLFPAAWVPWITAGSLPGTHFSITGEVELVKGMSCQ